MIRRIRIDNVRAFQTVTLFRQGGAILVSLLLAHSSLSKDSIGHYEQLLYLGFTVTSFWVTGLMQALLSKYAQVEPQQQAHFLFSVFLVFSGLGGTLLLGLWWGRHWVVPALTGMAELPYLLPFLLFLGLNLSSFLLDNFYLLWQRPMELLLLGGLSHALQVLAVLWPVWQGYGLQGAIWALVGVGGLRMLWLLAGLLRFTQAGWAGTALKAWLATAIPLMLYAVVSTISVSFDSWLVNHHYNGDQDIFALFRYGARELPLALALAAAFGTAMLPEVAAGLKPALALMKRKSLRLYHLLFPLSIVLLASSAHWFPWVFSEAFRDSVPVFNIFLLVVISRMLFPRTVLIGLDASQAVFYFSLVELGLNIALGFLLVSPFGLSGVAWATVLAYTADKAMLCAYLYYRFGIRPGAYTPVPWFLGYTVVLLAVYGLVSGG